MSHLVTVTGATGNTGKAIVHHLLERGIRVRAVARTAGNLAALAAIGAEVYPGNLQDPVFLTETFQGAAVVYALIPLHYDVLDFGADVRRSVASMVEALRRARISHVVTLSSTGADVPSGTGPPMYLYELETQLRAIPGLSVLSLRTPFFMENHLAAIPFIQQAGIYGGALHAELVMSMIATRDIAVMAADYLADPDFSGFVTRVLYGGGDYTPRTAAAILGAAIDQPDLAYVEFPYADFAQGLQVAGLTASAAEHLVEMYGALNEGRMPGTVDRNAFNTTPTTLEQFAREVFAPAYRKPYRALEA